MQRPYELKEGGRVWLGSARFERHPIANLVHLGRQDVVGTAALCTVFPQTVLLVEATSPAVLAAHPEREDVVSGGTRVLDRRIHQGWSRFRPCNLFRDVEAAEF